MNSNDEKNKRKKIIVITIAAVFITILLFLKACSSTKTSEDAIGNGENNSSSEIAKKEVADQEKDEKVVEVEIVDETKNDKETVEEKETKEETTLSYYVNFLNIDGSVLQRTTYKKGELPAYNGTTPTYSDDVYYYTFTGWNKTISKVSSTQTYTATYSKTYIGNDYDDSKETTAPSPVTVSKVTPTVTVTAKTLLYTGSPIKLVNISTTGGTLKYKLDGGEYSDNIPEETEAGDYTVYYKVEGDDNFNDVAEQFVNVTISEGYKLDGSIGSKTILKITDFLGSSTVAYDYGSKKCIAYNGYISTTSYASWYDAIAFVAALNDTECAPSDKTYGTGEGQGTWRLLCSKDDANAWYKASGSPRQFSGTSRQIWSSIEYNTDNACTWGTMDGIWNNVPKSRSTSVNAFVVIWEQN